jgi:ketosteroid isomerase-like protein
MRRLRHIVVILAVSLALPVAAADLTNQAQDIWDFDSIAVPQAPTTANQVAARQINDMQMAMVEKWNAHDLDGFLDYYWHSPALVILEDGVATTGWQEISDRYHHGFPDLNNMGHSNLARVQVRMLSPDAALVVTSWTIGLPRTKRLLEGTDSAYVQRIGGAWKVVLSHSSQLEM